MRNRTLVLLLLLSPTCGKKQKPPPVGAPPQPVAAQSQPQESPAPPPQAPPPSKPDPADAQTRADVHAKVKELEKAIKDMEARHEEERKGLPEMGPLRSTYIQAIRDARAKESELLGMQERHEELKKLAESAARGKLTELREERSKIEARKSVIQDAWRQSQEDVAHGTVTESPVKKDLDTVRAVKQQWFAATPLARRGTAGDGEKKIINDGFRSWLGDVPDRKRVVGQVLAQPLGPKGKTPDTYDFTDLSFFILLELMQEQLERQNIVVEKKELSESRVKIEAIDKELDALDEKIREQMLAGGEELQEYEELLERLDGVKQTASYLSTRVGELNAILKQVVELKDRQSRELDELDRALEAAKKQLR